MPSPHASRALRALIVVAVLAVLAPTAASAQENPSPLPVDPGENAKIRITQLSSLNVVVEPADHAAYASLFGVGIEPHPPVRGAAARRDPERPLIDFKVHSVGGTMETWVDLRASFCGRDGWFNNATAVDNPALYAVSRGTGYPKIMAEEITLTDEGDTAFGQVVQLGEPLVTLEWRDDPFTLRRLLAEKPWYRHWIAGEGAAYAGKSWTYEPIADLGPFVKEVQTDPDPSVDQVWESRPGVVRVTVNQDANPLLTNGDWMRLVPEVVEVPGVIEHYRGAADFYGRSLQCGVEGSIGLAPPHVGPNPFRPGTGQ